MVGRKYTCLYGKFVTLIQEGQFGVTCNRKVETGDDRKRTKGQNM